MHKSELINSLKLDPTQFNKLANAAGVGIKEEYSESEASQISQQLGSKLGKRQQGQNNTGSTSIVTSAQKRTTIAKRESMAQAAQDAQEANRVYAQTFLTVLNAGTEEFTTSLTQHLGGMRESLLEVEDDEDFLSQLMAEGCGGALPTNG